MVIQRLYGEPADFGDNVQEWRDLFSCWAALEPLGGDERVVAQQVEATVTHRVTIRYRSDIQPGPMDRCKVDPSGRILNIRNVIDRLNRHEDLEMLCSEEPS